VVAAWVAILCLMCGLLLPAVTEVRDGGEAWVGAANNLKQVGMAVLNYQTVVGEGRLPAVAWAWRGKDGRPTLSWRVTVLPFLEEERLFAQFDLDEPWDGPHNKPLLAKMPRVFARSPSDFPAPPYATHFQAVVGPGTAFEKDGLKPAAFPDGAANTILVVEAAEAVPWTKPEDVSYDPAGPLPRLGTGLTKAAARVGGFTVRRKAGFLAAFGDGAVRFIDARTDEATLRALITRNGGEAVDVSKLD
jgi:hypothetical protein